MLERMVRTPAKPPEDDSRLALLKAARKIFSKSGLEGATVKELADEAGVNVSLVSYYFGGKDGLYRECLLSFAEERWQAMTRILQPADSTEEFRTRLLMLAEEMAEVHINEPDICRIVHRDIQNMSPAAVEVFKLGFFKIFETFVKFLKSAEKKGLIRPLEDAELTTSLVFGSLMHLLQSEPHRTVLGRPSIKDPKYRKAMIHQWLAFAYEGLVNQHASPGKK